MPLGNLTSQFFANVYLNELDQFVKHKLRAKYYIRYVDDFVILHESKEQLEEWKIKINNFLKEKLKIELHPSKSHVLRLNSGINFLGFRVFSYHKLIRASNLKNFERRFNNMKILFNEGIIGKEKALEFLEGWLAYCSYANTYKYRKYLIRNFNKSFSHGNRLLVHNKKNYANYIKRVKESELQFSTQRTLFNYKKRLSIKEIAIKEGIKESTVLGHLINLIEYGQLSVWEVLPREKICKILNKIYSHKERLRDIRKRLKDETITYDDIACVIASIKSKKRWKKNKKCPVTE
ncbi:MAG: helix-turn-helix domain-containing protein [Nanoarchaeota archaeon]|nr:helix-turn-helix domain-containing protein [Nanoarchaeota archaeon]